MHFIYCGSALQSVICQHSHIFMSAGAGAAPLALPVAPMSTPCRNISIPVRLQAIDMYISTADSGLPSLW